MWPFTYQPTPPVATFLTPVHFYLLYNLKEGKQANVPTMFSEILTKDSEHTLVLELYLEDIFLSVLSFVYKWGNQTKLSDKAELANYNGNAVCCT